MITAPILATSIMLIGLGSAAAWSVHRLNQEVPGLLAQNLECTVASERLVLGIRDARVQMHRFLDTGDPRMLEAIAEIEKAAAQHLREAEQTATTDEIVDLVHRAQRSHERFFADFHTVMGNLPAAARQQKVREYAQLIGDELLAPADVLLERTQQAAVEYLDRNRSVASEVGTGLLVIGACGAIGGLMAGFAIAHGIARRIEQSEHEAARSEQLAATGQLAAGLAHELRNPLTAMRVLIEAGLEHTASADGLDRRDLQVLEEEISRLERLVDSFLDFARPPRLEKSAVDACTLIEQTLHLLAGPARQRGVTINWTPPAELVTIEADAVQMRQVLLNLLLNAMDAVGASGIVNVDLQPEVSLAESPLAARAASADLGRDTYRAIRISDSGPGVADDMKERIFEPFVSSKETGMGLGLAVSRRIVEAHHGAITVSDGPNGGALFTIWLPASTRCVEGTAAGEARAKFQADTAVCHGPREHEPCKPC
jgi:signal transduction histidine kinase